jgi:hypothetical protein
MIQSELMTDPLKAARSGTPLTALDWTRARAQHEKRVDQLLRPHLERRSRNGKHPVHDFLFNYYSIRPYRLRRWRPGIHTVLQGTEALQFLDLKGYRETPDGISVDPKPATWKRRQAVRWICSLLQACAARPPQFACFGLHEWAMVYRSSDWRHQGVPLRFSEIEVARVVEAHTLRCSHFDAFRFFTPEARPLNRCQLGPEDRLQHEQRGCLHVNMDLYKWAGKLQPWTPSSLVIDCLELAFAIREVDMRASPYDLAALGYPPIKIETPSGKDEYEDWQRRFAQSAVPLREKLINICNGVLGAQ